MGRGRVRELAAEAGLEGLERMAHGPGGPGAVAVLPTPGRVVLFAHETIVGLVLPAVVVATVGSLAAVEDPEELGLLDWPLLTDDGRERCHLAVFYAGGRDPIFGRLASPVRPASNVPFGAGSGAGTWRWPDR